MNHGRTEPEVDLDFPSVKNLILLLQLSAEPDAVRTDSCRDPILVLKLHMYKYVLLHLFEEGYNL